MDEKTTATLDLEAGTRVAVAPTLNAAGFTGTVASVEPWILTRGAKAGQQARGGGEPLWTVTIIDVAVASPPLGRASEHDAWMSTRPTRLMAAPAERLWTVAA